MKSFLIFELWIRLNQTYSRFSYKSEITRKSRKPVSEGFVELPSFLFSEECATGEGWYGQGGGGATYLFFRWVCMSDDPKL